MLFGDTREMARGHHAVTVCASVSITGTVCHWKCIFSFESQGSPSFESPRDKSFASLVAPPSDAAETVLSLLAGAERPEPAGKERTECFGERGDLHRVRVLASAEGAPEQWKAWYFSAVLFMLVHVIDNT